MAQRDLLVQVIDQTIDAMRETTQAMIDDPTIEDLDTFMDVTQRNYHDVLELGRIREELLSS